MRPHRYNGLVRKTAVAAAFVVLGATAGLASPAGAVPEGYSGTGGSGSPDRIYGEDRYHTSIEAMDNLESWGFLGRGDTVVIASGENYTDAIVSASLAGAAGGSVLLWPDDPEHPRIESNLNFLAKYWQPDDVYIITTDGEGALDDDSIDDIYDRLPDSDIVELSGDDAYDTAALVAEKVRYGYDTVSEFIYIATSGSFADIVSVAADSYGRAVPIILVDPDSDELPASSEDAIIDHSEDCDCDLEAVIIGGTAAVSADLEDEIEDLVDSVVRIGGKDRYETNYNVAMHLYDTCDECFSGDVGVVFVTGGKFPDSLSAAAVTYLNRDILVLVQPKDEKDSSIEWIKKLVLNSEIFEDDDELDALIIGGPAAVADDIGLFDEDFTSVTVDPASFGSIDGVVDVWLGGFAHDNDDVKWSLPMSGQVGDGIVVTVDDDSFTGGGYAAMWRMHVQSVYTVDGSEDSRRSNNGCGDAGSLVFPSTAKDMRDHNNTLGKMLYICPGTVGTVGDLVDDLNVHPAFSSAFHASISDDLEDTPVDEFVTDATDKFIAVSSGAGGTAIVVFVEFDEDVDPEDFEDDTFYLLGACDISPVNDAISECGSYNIRDSRPDKEYLADLIGEFLGDGIMTMSVDVDGTYDLRDKMDEEAHSHDTDRVIALTGTLIVDPSDFEWPPLSGNGAFDMSANRGWAHRAPSNYHAALLDDSGDWFYVRRAFSGTDSLGSVSWDD